MTKDWREAAGELVYIEHLSSRRLGEAWCVRLRSPDPAIAFIELGEHASEFYADFQRKAIVHAIADALARAAEPRAGVEGALSDIRAALAAIDPNGDPIYAAGYRQGLLEAEGAIEGALTRAAAPRPGVEEVVNAAIAWQDAPRLNDGHPRDRSIEDRLLAALNDYRYPVSPPPAPRP